MVDATLKGLPSPRKFTVLDADDVPAARGNEHPTYSAAPEAVDEEHVVRLAVVDDDPTWLELVEVGLESRGYRVCTFESGDALLESPKLSQVDAVVSDYALPGMNGVELCEAVHAVRPSLPTLLCTGHPLLDAAVSAMRCGSSDYLTKPISIAELDARIRGMLGRPERAEPARHRVRLRLECGKTIAGTQYRIDEWLGEGGMGTVYRGLNLAIERPVALKVLHADFCRKREAVRNFRNEARASALIGAPNLVDILDFVELRDGRLLIVMELLDGIPLHRLLYGEPIEIPRLIGIARQICKGLSAAHAAGIVHRDIKPDNVMLVTRSGQPDFVKLIDFGIAAFGAEEEGLMTAGTPAYMAPEAISSAATGPSLDQYALGCVLYELISGQPPFVGDPADVCGAHLDQEPPVLEPRKGQALPEGLAQIIERILKKDPSQRYANMDELEVALCELQVQLGVVLPYELPLPDVEPQRRAVLAASMPTRATIPRRRRRWLVGVAAAAVAVLAAGWIGEDPATPAATLLSAHDQEVERHVAAATAAASRLNFVYPPADDREAPTAYREVVALEAMQTEAADAAAAELRAQFAQTLAERGDHYWQYRHGRGFASEFYAMAVLFDPSREPARDRVALTPGMLAELGQRAESSDFAEGELRTASVLRVLAEEDESRQQEQLGDLEADSAQSPMVVTQVEQLREERGDRRRAPRVLPSPVPRLPRLPTVEEPDPEVDDGREERQRQRDAQKAETFIERAVKARRHGDTERAVHLYHRAIDRDPGNLKALDGLAALYFDSANYSKAAHYAQLATERGSKRSSRWLLLGDAYFKSLRYRDARSAYRRAEQLGSDGATLRLAKLDRKLGH